MLYFLIPLPILSMHLSLGSNPGVGWVGRWCGLHADKLGHSSSLCLSV